MGTKYIDLHLHLDGAITAEAAMELAKVQGISLPAKTEKELAKLISVPEGCTSLNDFLRCFELPLSLLQTREEVLWAALEMGAVRIGHGVRVRKNPEILEEIRSRGIALEMCPTSNRYTRSIENMKDYPLLMYLENGIKVTVNTDDPAIEGTTISREFRFLKEHFGLTTEQEKTILQNAAEAAFTSDERKHSLYKNISEIL